MRLLIEGEVSNQLVANGDLVNAAWAKTRVTVTAGAANDYLGGATLAKINETSATGVLSHTLTQTIAVVAGERFEFEVMAKAAERQWLQMYFQGTVFGGSTQRIWFDLLNGKLGTATTLAKCKIIDCGSGILRLVVGMTPTVSGILTIGLAPSPSNNSATYEGALNSGVFIGNVIFNKGLIGSWAPNGRSVDKFSMAFQPNVFSKSSGFAMRCVAFELPFAGKEAGIFVDDDGTANNRFYAAIQSDGTVKVGATLKGIEQTSVIIGTIAPGSLFGLACGYNGDTSLWFLNGFRAIVGPARPINLTTRRFGNSKFDYSSPLFGEIESVKQTVVFWNKTLLSEMSKV